jgi:hypothetical protein
VIRRERESTFLTEASFAGTTVSFASPVANLSFQIRDVDAVAAEFADKIWNIQLLAQERGTIE